MGQGVNGMEPGGGCLYLGLEVLDGVQIESCIEDKIRDDPVLIGLHKVHEYIGML